MEFKKKRKNLTKRFLENFVENIFSYILYNDCFFTIIISPLTIIRNKIKTEQSIIDHNANSLEKNLKHFKLPITFLIIK